MEISKFRSSGKFLITAEYLILKGAKGLALPLKYGQQLEIKTNVSELLNWTSKSFNDSWFSAQYKIHSLDIIATNNSQVAQSLQQILLACRFQNTSFLQTGVDAQMAADFDLSWGLGSSSTLINCVANWARVDPYQLLEKTFGGSGYDIACASAKGPITYQLNPSGRLVNEVNFNPQFKDHIFFVYLGKKMNSRTGMSYFKEKAVYTNVEINMINNITDQLINCKDLSHFEALLNQHEQIMSQVLQMPTIKDSLFQDYPFTIKSMGAWGGDFMLVTGKSLAEVKAYFNSKSLNTVLTYSDMALS